MIPSAEMLGAHRVLEPPGSLPQAAWRLDAESPPGATELAVDVELISLDATSHRQLAEAAGGDPSAIEESIAEIVQTRGKMHNPVTGSGGILVGAAAAIGPEFPADGLRLGDRVASLASLTLTPLRLDAIGPVDAASPHVPVRGRAIVSATAPWTRLPDDLSLPVVVAVLDVCGAPAHTRALANTGEHVMVIGAGRAGLLSLAAAREAVGVQGRVTALDLSSEAIAAVLTAGLCDAGVVADATNPVETVAQLARQNIPSADLTVFVVDAPRCELTAVLATRPGGTVLFFSMATSFTAAALGAEGFGSSATMLIGSGYTSDRGEFAMDLVRRTPPLWELLTAREQAAA